jgi:protoporphyrinogen oxidase
MKEWLAQNFGPTLCDIFFYPFHQLYTAGLFDKIAPQDSYKTPVDLKKVIQGVSSLTSPVGYNTEFVYPINGLNSLAQELAGRCNLHYAKRIMGIDIDKKELRFSDNTSIHFDYLISTLPLNQMIDMAGMTFEVKPDPYSSVLVLNIGANRGDKCPDDHWLYIPRSRSGFHRVGFYSNVDRTFLPLSERNSQEKVSIYVERAYEGGSKPTSAEIDVYKAQVVQELQEWGFIFDAEVVDPTWIDVAYTWSLPGSDWKNWAITALERYDIYQVGRYGRWTFNGIAASLIEGLTIGSAHKPK